MFRCALFAVAACALVPDTRAAGPELKGNWVLSYALPHGDTAECILKVETANGKTTATAVASPKGVHVTLTAFAVTDKRVTLTYKTTQFAGSVDFVGTVGKDGKVVYGTLRPANSLRPSRAKMTPTDKTAIDAPTPSPAADDYKKAMDLASLSRSLRTRMQQTKDADQKKALQKELAEAREEEAAKVPALLRSVIAKHPNTVAAGASAPALIRSPYAVLTSEEAAALVELIRRHCEPYGPEFEKLTMADAAELLAARTDVGAEGLSLIEPVAKGLTAATKPADRVRILGLYKTALESGGRTGDAKAVAAELAAFEAKLDAEYLASVPPFKPTPYAGRKNPAANRVAVLELFTSVDADICAAPDAAFDAVALAYKPTDVVLVQYHMHSTTPLSNPDAIARGKYYAAGGVPSAFFNGKAAGRVGGAMTLARAKFGEFTGLLNPTLEQQTGVKVSGSAVRTGDKIDIGVDVSGPAGDDVRVRLLLVEDAVRHTGSNQLRFHHRVVRAMPGGADGFAVEKDAKHRATADVAAIKTAQVKFADDHVVSVRPFPEANRPPELKRLKVVALVQNDATKEVVQAAQFDVTDKP
jgi:hypothetical protein